jgi:DNA mismatch endonuclease (patch repair protein)
MTRPSDDPKTPGSPSAAEVPQHVSVRMSRQRSRNTKPEMVLRRELHCRGMRYRVDAALPGMGRRRADVLFPRAKVAVFVDGCFWHRCPIHGVAPKSNAAWWDAKLAGNVARDLDTNEHLTRIGWMVLRFWEHEDMKDAAVKVRGVLDAVKERERRKDLPTGREGH